MIRNNFFHGLAVVDVGLVTLGPIHVIGFGVEHGADLALKLEEQGYAWLEDGGIETLNIESPGQSANP